MFVVENKFSVLINKSKEPYFVKMWKKITRLFKSLNLNIIFEQNRRLIIISNRKKCTQPMMLFKGVMFIRLVNRNVPYIQSRKIFRDSYMGLIIKTSTRSNFLLNNFIMRCYKENYTKNIESITNCIIIPYGETLSILGLITDVIYLLKALRFLKLSK
mmetsp:Transcript_6064/g.8356  ORF Transcript_6064/g.8356 Transcript_6064/m.8356 type:complete len:158 (+) Transcript_6064:193-666(+)